MLDLSRTQITDAGCATLVAALDSGALPALAGLGLDRIPARKGAIDAIYAALARSTAATTPQLTAGAMNSMNDNTLSFMSFMGTTPTLQLLDVKKIPPANDHAMAQDRYRLDISDGTQMMPAMLATQLNFMMDSGQVCGDPSPCRRRRITPRPSPRPLPKSHAGRSTPRSEHSLLALRAAVAAAKVLRLPAGRVHLQHRAEPPHHHRPQPHPHPGLQRADR